MCTYCTTTAQETRMPSSKEATVHAYHVRWDINTGSFLDLLYRINVRNNCPCLRPYVLYLYSTVENSVCLAVCTNTVKMNMYVHTLQYGTTVAGVISFLFCRFCSPFLFFYPISFTRLSFSSTSLSTVAAIYRTGAFRFSRYRCAYK